MIVVTVLAVGAGWYLNRVERQKRAVEWVKENGGAVFYVFQRAEGYGRAYHAVDRNKNWLRSLFGNDATGYLDYVSVAPTESEDLSAFRGVSVGWLVVGVGPKLHCQSLQSVRGLEELDLIVDKHSDAEGIELLKRKRPKQSYLVIYEDFKAIYRSEHPDHPLFGAPAAVRKESEMSQDGTD